MSKYFLKEIIIDVLREEEDVLMNAFMANPKFKKYASGDNYMSVKNRENWLIMDDVNVPCGHAFNELLTEGIIIVQSCRIDVAIAGGDLYRLPIYDPSKKHKSLHWMPMKVIKGPNFPEI